MRTGKASRRRPRVAFVVQRCGREVNGGAELHCLQIAQHMAAYWNTEVLTTCALDYMEWRNHYPEGVEELDGTTIRRFVVDHPRDVASFNELSEELYSRQSDTSLDEQEKWMRAQGPISTGLLSYLERNTENYDLFIFFGYLYATTYFGLPLVAGKSVLAPLAHDEWPIYFGMWDSFFCLPQAFLFNTEVEKDFLNQRFPSTPLPGIVVGAGLDIPRKIDARLARERYQLHEPFLLYLGRIDESKGCIELLDWFRRYRRSGRGVVKLVLAGKEYARIPFDDDIVHLGFVSDDEKWSALAACEWLVMPSPYESLSLTTLEAWAAGRPALVTAKSDVLRRHCELSNAGIVYSNFYEWQAAINTTTPDERAKLGANGKRYVSRRYTWDRVEKQYRALASDLLSATPPQLRPKVVT